MVKLCIAYTAPYKGQPSEVPHCGANSLVNHSWKTLNRAQALNQPWVEFVLRSKLPQKPKCCRRLRAVFAMPVTFGVEGRSQHESSPLALTSLQIRELVCLGGLTEDTAGAFQELSLARVRVEAFTRKQHALINGEVFGYPNPQK